jgi:hypothetical protein
MNDTKLKPSMSKSASPVHDLINIGLSIVGEVVDYRENEGDAANVLLFFKSIETELPNVIRNLHSQKEVENAATSAAEIVAYDLSTRLEFFFQIVRPLENSSTIVAAIDSVWSQSNALELEKRLNSVRALVTQ